MRTPRALTIATAGIVLGACGIDAVGAFVADVGTGSVGAEGGAGAGGDSAVTDNDGAVADGTVADGDVDGGFVLSVAVAGSGGSALVTSDVGGISCPPSCSAVVASGTKVTLTAAPAPDETLLTWSGACAGREPACALDVTAATSVGASFAALLQYVQSASNLYAVNGATGAATLVAAFGGACAGITVGDIAIDRAGKAYAVTLPSGGVDGDLHPLTLATATCGAAVGTLGRRCNALTFAPDPADVTKDALFAACTGSFYRVSLATGATTLIGALGLDSSGDTVWVPGLGVFITLNDGSGNDKLGKVNLATGAASVIGTGVGEGAVYALGHRGGKILGYGNGFAIVIDPKTGTGTSLNAATNVNAYGAASAP